MNITLEQLGQRINELRQNQAQFQARAKQDLTNADACKGAIMECQRLIKLIQDEEKAAADAEQVPEGLPTPTPAEGQEVEE